MDNRYWQGTVVTFSGLSAKFFYMLLKEKKLTVEVFSDGIFGRFDIYYCREDERTEKLIKTLRKIFWRLTIIAIKK